MKQRRSEHSTFGICEYSFKNCLENLNTSSSNVLGEPEIDLYLQNLNAVKRKSIVNRCSKYDLDRGQPQLLQMFVVPFNDNASLAFECKLSTEISFSFFVSCLFK